MILIAALIVLPLAIWAATSLGEGDGDDEQALIVSRSSGLTGEPELLISLTAAMSR